MLNLIHRHPYWINAARNVARKSASTPYILASDVELYPSPRLAENFELMVKNLSGSTSKIVYVVPAFEIDVSQRDRLPKSRKSLLKLYRTDKAVYFHALTCQKCQKFPKLDHWLKTKIEPGTMIKN